LREYEQRLFAELVGWKGQSKGIMGGCKGEKKKKRLGVGVGVGAGAEDCGGN
jgi:hypothetical protein